MYSFYDDFGLPITLTFNAAEYEKRTAQHVLIFPFFQGKLLFVKHLQRGIELPGGKIELEETSLAAAVRETYEETGYSLSAIEKFGQYVVNEELVKDIFVARAERFIKEMNDSAVEGAISFNTIPELVKGNPQFSRYLYDDVYPLAVTHIRSHRFASTV